MKKEKNRPIDPWRTAGVKRQALDFRIQTWVHYLHRASDLELLNANLGAFLARRLKALSNIPDEVKLNQDNILVCIWEIFPELYLSFKPNINI